MKKIILSLLLCLVTTSVFAEKAILVRLPNGKLVGVVYTATGNIVLTDIQILEFPGPAPNPTPVPVPTKVVRVMIVYETNESTQELANLINKIRNDQTLSKKVLILDKDTKDENREPDTEIQLALKLFNGASLPRLAGFDVENKPIVQEALTKTANGKEVAISLDEFKVIMKKWGLLTDLSVNKTTDRIDSKAILTDLISGEVILTDLVPTN